jgi:transaldolase
MSPSDLKIKIFADGADLDGIAKLAREPWIKGFTTNPTLMRKNGISDYAGFARDMLRIVPDRPVSFEVFADDLPTMERQAHEIATWGKNVNVKIPVTTTQGEFCGPIIQRLSAAGVMVNVTAVFTPEQVFRIAECLSPNTPAIVSVFAGRVADTGVDPMPLMRESLRILQSLPKAELLWASPRELLNVVQADEIGCQIITVTSDLLAKLNLLGKSLDQFSLETVEMFRRDAVAAGYEIQTDERKRASA